MFIKHEKFTAVQETKYAYIAARLVIMISYADETPYIIVCK